MTPRRPQEWSEVCHWSSKRLLRHSACIILLASLGCVAEASGFQIKSGHKAKVTGPIMSRDGDFLIVRDQKANVFVVIGITGHTRIERTKKGFQFRHPDMDVTALVPGLTVKAEGVGNVRGELDAREIAFDPGEFGRETASGQQIVASDPTSKMDSTPRQLATSAPTGRSAAGISRTWQVNSQVSDLTDYENVAQAGVYFAPGKMVLDGAAMKALDKIAGIARPIPGYLIEVAGSVAGTGSIQLDESLSAARAEAVAQYLVKKREIPLRRILAPPGYEATHPDAPNRDPEGRALSRRVDVTVLVNEGSGVRRAGL